MRTETAATLLRATVVLPRGLYAREREEARRACAIPRLAGRVFRADTSAGVALQGSFRHQHEAVASMPRFTPVARGRYGSVV